MVNSAYIDQVEKRSLELGAPTFEKFNDGNNTIKWDEEAERQWKLHPPETTQFFDKNVYELCNKKSVKTVMDVGCGTGLLIYSLPKGKKYIGVDQNNTMLSYAKMRTEQVYGSATQILKSPITDISTGYPDLLGTIDRLVTFTVLQHNHLRTTSKALEDFYKLLSPKGELLLLEGTLNPETYTKEICQKYRHPEIDFDTEIGAVSGGYFTVNGWKAFLAAHDFEVINYIKESTLFHVRKVNG